MHLSNCDGLYYQLYDGIFQKVPQVDPVETEIYEVTNKSFSLKSANVAVQSCRKRVTAKAFIPVSFFLSTKEC